MKLVWNIILILNERDIFNKHLYLILYETERGVIKKNLGQYHRSE